MKFKYFFLASLASLVFLGNGCVGIETNTNISTSTLREMVMPLLQENLPQGTTTPVTEPEYNTPLLEDKERQRESVIRDDSYFFIVENKNNEFGSDFPYGVLSVKMDCSEFVLVDLSSEQPLNLSLYKNKAIRVNEYEFVAGTTLLKQIEENKAQARAIENFKKTCPDPFGRYMVSSVPLTGVHLYVESLDQSSKNVLSAINGINVAEYKQAQLSDKNQIKTFFFTVPNNKFIELESILRKEANDNIVYGAKILFGDLGGEVERAEHGTTNFEIKLISVNILK